MEEEVAYRRGSAMGNNTLSLNYSQMSNADAGSVDLVGRLKTLSSGRKKLMTKYFDLDDIESGPLLSEYFAVSLAFVALGAMIREANVRMRRKDKENSDGVSPKLQRMALDSMLKSAMERLRGLAHRTQTLEDNVRDRTYMEAAFQFERLDFLKRISGLEATIAKHAELEAGWRREKEDLTKRIAEVDAQRGYFFKKMAEADSSLADLQRLRMEDGKANAKLVEIYAGREQSWKSERIRMRHDIELLKEKLSKLQPQSQIKSPHSFDAAAEALKLRNMKRRAKEMVRDKVVSERELFVLDRTPKSEVDSRSAKESPVFADDQKDSEATDSHELSAAQNQEMEAELAIILKRVGALKRRGSAGSKLDELLNEAKTNPKMKRFGSFDQAPKGMVIDDTFLCRSEVNNVKDVEIDDGAKDIWQAIEFQEGMNVQRRNGLVDGVSEPRDPSRSSVFHAILTSPEKKSSHRTPDGDGSPVRMNLLGSSEFTVENPLTPERNFGERGSEGSTTVDHDIVPGVVALNRSVRNDVEPLNLDEGGWEEFVLVNPSTPEKNIGQSTRSEGLTFVGDDRSPDSVAENRYLTPARTEIQPLNLDQGSWEEFILESPNSPEKRAPEGSVADRTAECGAVNRYSASQLTVSTEIEPLSLDEGGWEEFVEESTSTSTSTTATTTVASTPESNIGQRISEGSTFADHDEAPESVAVNSILTVEPNQNETLNLDEGGRVESTDNKSGREGYSITYAEHPGSLDEAPVPSPAHDAVGIISGEDPILLEEDIKSEIDVAKDETEEAPGMPSPGSQGHQVLAKDSAVGGELLSAESSSPSETLDVGLAHDSAVGVDPSSAESFTSSEIPDASLAHDSALEFDRWRAESGNPGEIPDASLARDVVEHLDGPKLSEEDVKSEIVSNPISSSPTLGFSSDHIHMDDHMNQLNRTDVSEGRNDEIIDNGQSPLDRLQVVQDYSNNSTQQLGPDVTSMASLEPRHLALNGGS